MMTVALMIPQAYPLFKGCTRQATVMGVPLVPLMSMIMLVAMLAMVFSLWWWALTLPCWLTMASITRYDDQAFRIWGLWLSCQRFRRLQGFWQAATYTPTPGYRRVRR